MCVGGDKRRELSILGAILEKFISHLERVLIEFLLAKLFEALPKVFVSSLSVVYRALQMFNQFF